MEVNSPAWKFNSADWQKVLSNALTFLAPLAVIYFSFVAANIQDGFAWTDFTPNTVTTGAMILYVLNVLLDFFRKLSADNTQ